MRWRVLLVSLTLVLVAALPLGVAGASGPRIHESTLAHAPLVAHALRNPYEGRPEAVATGRKLFLIHCAQCHGDDARGGRRGPGLDSAVVRQALPGDLFWLLTNGNLAQGMPSWSHLPRARRWQIVAYLKAASAETSGSTAGSHGGPGLSASNGS